VRAVVFERVWLTGPCEASSLASFSHRAGAAITYHAVTAMAAERDLVRTCRDTPAPAMAMGHTAHRHRLRDRAHRSFFMSAPRISAKNPFIVRAILQPAR